MRVQVRSLLAALGFLAIVSLSFQYFNAKQEIKSRRNRLKVVEETPISEKVTTTTSSTTYTTTSTKYPCNVNENVHAFYYPWYGAPDVDESWIHWNHPVLPHWIARVNAQYPIGTIHQPKDDIGSTFYPQLGPYSSSDDSVIHQHMKWCCQAGIGTLAVSYFAKDRTDENGKPFQHVVDKILNAASEYGIKIALHMEPYEGRTASSVKDDIKSTIELMDRRKDDVIARIDNRPVFYLYDSYGIPGVEWFHSLTSLRNTKYDPYVVGLVVEVGHVNEIVKSGFDAAYSYFAAVNFSYGCTPRNWRNVQALLAKKNIYFFPSVGPGYDDTSIRPWNAQNSKNRENGKYYLNYWSEAMKINPKVITITSFNEWHEGTQIEPAIDFKSEHKRVQGPQNYPSYEYPRQYLDLTRKVILEWNQM